MSESDVICAHQPKLNSSVLSESWPEKHKIHAAEDYRSIIFAQVAINVDSDYPPYVKDTAKPKDKDAGDNVQYIMYVHKRGYQREYLLKIFFFGREGERIDGGF